MLQALTGGAQPMTKIAAGSFLSLFLKSNGSLLATNALTGGSLTMTNVNPATNAHRFFRVYLIQ